MIRPGRDADSPGVIALIRRCWADYPGCILDVEQDQPGLLAPASHFAGQGGMLWVAEAAGTVVGMAAVTPIDRETWEIRKVYVHPDRHGAGLAHALLDTAEQHAVAAGAVRLRLWTDIRFDRAHRFYEKRSWVRDGPIRPLDDMPDILEFGYAKPVDGVAVLDAAAASSAVRRLAEILVVCVDDGASVSFLPPLAQDVAREYMRGIASQAAQGRCVLLGAWSGGVLAGTVRVQLDTPPNQPHRADIAKLLVHPAHRRRGLARALMLAAEAAALQAGRSLLTLDTETGAAGERLYAGLGWTAVGRIPGYAKDAAGQPVDTTFFYKTLGQPAAATSPATPAPAPAALRSATTAR